MEIVYDQLIRNKFHAGFDRDAPPSEIVIHGTGGGGTYRYVLQGGREDEYRRGVALFHYLIGRNGMAVEIIDPDRWVYHSSSGRHDRKTIGIELSNHFRDNGGTYTEAQYKALEGLITELLHRYPIKLIRGHSRSYELFTGGKKPGPSCPGSEFDWNRLVGIAETSGHKVIKNHEEITIEI